MDWFSVSEIVTTTAFFFGGASLFTYRKFYQSRIIANNALRLINNLSEGVYAAEMDGRLKSANRALVTLHGYSSEREMLQAVNNENAQFYVERGRRAEFQRMLMRDGYVQDFVSEIYRQKTKDRIWVSESARLVVDTGTGEPSYYEGSLRDVTESIRKRQAEARLHKLANIAPGGLFQLRREANGTYSVPFMSQPFMDIAGLTAQHENPSERPLLPGVYADDVAEYNKSLTDSFLKQKPWHCVFRYQRDAGSPLQWLEIKALPEPVENGAIEWSGCMADISEHKELVQRIERMAYFDPLTDLPNRRLLLNRIEEAVKISGRRRRHGGLLFIDLDGFKAINDTYGHEAGDIYISKIAQCLQNSIRDSDTIARLGGDEFVVLLHDLDADVEAAKQDASFVAGKLMGNLRRGVELNGVVQSVCCSIGITVFKGGLETAETHIKNADRAMYQAKAEGRNRFLVYQGDKDIALKQQKGAA